MAVAAVNAQASDVVLMAEGHRLFRRNVLVRNVWGTLQLYQCRSDCRKENDNAEDASAR